MSDVTREDWQTLRDEMRAGFEGIHRRLDALNGRVRETEVLAARLDERAAALEGRRSPAWPGGIAGGIVAGVLAALEYLWRRP